MNFINLISLFILIFIILGYVAIKPSYITKVIFIIISINIVLIISNFNVLENFLNNLIYILIFIKISQAIFQKEI